MEIRLSRRTTEPQCLGTIVPGTTVPHKRFSYKGDLKGYMEPWYHGIVVPVYFLTLLGDTLTLRLFSFGDNHLSLPSPLRFGFLTTPALFPQALAY
jgi:hypothetical protein